MPVCVVSRKDACAQSIILAHCNRFQICLSFIMVGWQERGEHKCVTIRFREDAQIDYNMLPCFHARFHVSNVFSSDELILRVSKKINENLFFPLFFY